MRERHKFNWVQFTAGAILGAPAGFWLWVSLPEALTYSAAAGLACVLGCALLVGRLAGSRGDRFWESF